MKRLIWLFDLGFSFIELAIHVIMFRCCCHACGVMIAYWCRCSTVGAFWFVDLVCVCMQVSVVVNVASKDETQVCVDLHEILNINDCHWTSFVYFKELDRIAIWSDWLSKLLTCSILQSCYIDKVQKVSSFYNVHFKCGVALKRPF